MNIKIQQNSKSTRSFPIRLFPYKSGFRERCTRHLPFEHWIVDFVRQSDWQMSNLPPNELRIWLHLKRNHCIQTVHNNKRQIQIDELGNNIFSGIDGDFVILSTWKWTTIKWIIPKEPIKWRLYSNQWLNAHWVWWKWNQWPKLSWYSKWSQTIWRTKIRECSTKHWYVKNAIAKCKTQQLCGYWIKSLHCQINLNCIGEYCNEFGFVFFCFFFSFFFSTTDLCCSWFQFARNHWIAKIHIVRQFYETAEIIL